MSRMFLAVFLVIFAGCSSAPPTGPEAGRALIESAATAMGGWAALDAIKHQEVITAGGDWEPHQAIEPDADMPTVNNFGQTILVDLANKRMRLTFDAMRSYPAPAPVKYVEVINGDVAMLQTTDAQGKTVSERLHPSRFAARIRDLNRMPMRLLYTAKNATDVTREADIVQDRVTIQVLKFKDGNQPVEVHFDAFNSLPIRVINTEFDPIFGDTLNELAYSDWKEADGVRQPHTLAYFLNGKKIREERMRTLINNGTLDETAFAIPDEVRAQAENGERIVSRWTLRRANIGTGYQDFGREQKVELVTVSPGVYQVKGGSHHSMAIEMKDHLIVIETPLFEERSLAVIKALEEKIPGKPIKYAVVTHFHMDHSGGVRAYAAKGATIIGPESIVPFLKETLARPNTVRPDSLSKVANASPVVEGVAETRDLTDGERTVQLRQIPNPHAKGMLAAYLPNEKVVFVTDLYTPDPNTPVQPGNANAHAFYTALKNANLAVDRIVGGHGAIGPFRDLAKVDTPVRTGS